MTRLITDYVLHIVATTQPRLASLSLDLSLILSFIIPSGRAINMLRLIGSQGEICSPLPRLGLSRYLQTPTFAQPDASSVGAIF